MKLYSYDGPVLEFGEIVAKNWKAKTYAESESKARSNLAYQYKMQMGKVPRTCIYIPGKLSVVEGGSKRYGNSESSR